MSFSISFTAAQIADELHGEVVGDGSVQLTGFAPADRAKAGDLTFAEKPTYFAAAEQSAAAAILISHDFASSKKVLIRVPNARVAMARVLPLFHPTENHGPGIHPSAVIDPTASWGEMAGHPKDMEVASFEPGVTAAPYTLSSKFLGMGSPPADSAQFHTRMDTNKAVIGALYRAGVPIVAGSDTGLIGYGGAYNAINEADLLLLLGTDFPFSEFLPGASVKKVQIDKNPKHIGRRTALDLGLVGDIKSTVSALLPAVSEKTNGEFLARQIARTESFHKQLQHYVENGPATKPIRPEFLAATLSEIASDDAMFFADTGTACIWLARHIYGGKNRRLFGSFSWASMANAAPNAFGCALAYPGRQCIALCGDGGFTMLGMGDLLTQVERRTPVVQVILNNEKYDFVHIEQQEAGFIPSGVEFKNPNFAKVAEAMGAKGIRIEEPEDVREGLAEALAYKDGPVVVDAVVDPFALAMPSHSPFHTVKGFTLSFAKQVLSGRVDTVFKEIVRNVGLV